MEIMINGEKQNCTSPLYLSDLLVQRGYEPHSVVTAVNQNFVPITQRALCQLSSGDAVEILAPMQGG